MIPANSGLLKQDFIITQHPSKTYAMQINSHQIRGHTDKLQAMEQAIYKTISTERYQYIIYSRNYGVSLQNLFGEPLSYVIPEIQRRITDALLWDDRVIRVDSWNFTTGSLGGRGIVTATFNVSTIYGDIQMQREVNL